MGRNMDGANATRTQARLGQSETAAITVQLRKSRLKAGFDVNPLESGFYLVGGTGIEPVTLAV